MSIPEKSSRHTERISRRNIGEKILGHTIYAVSVGIAAVATIKGATDLDDFFWKNTLRKNKQKDSKREAGNDIELYGTAFLGSGIGDILLEKQTRQTRRHLIGGAAALIAGKVFQEI